MTLKKRALTALFWSALEQFGNQIIGFIISIILARLLLPAEFGLLAMVAVIIAIGNILIHGGLTQSLIRSGEVDNRDYSTVFYFNLFGSVVIYAITFVSAPLIADFFGQQELIPILRVLGITFIIGAFSAIQSTRLNKMMDFKTQMIVSTPSMIIGGISGILLAFYGYGVWSLVYSRIIQSTASTVQLWFHSKWQPMLVFDRERFRKHFGFGFKLMLSGLIDTIFTNAYTIIIGKFFAASQVGYYYKADGLQMLPVRSLSQIVTKITYPLFSEVQNNNVQLRGIYKRIMQMVLFFIAPTLIIMAVLGEPLFRFLFTEKWLPSVPYFQILCVGGILYPIHAYNLQILNVKGKSGLFLKLEIVKKILLVIVILISFQFGIFGLLYGSVIVSMLSFFVNTHYSGKFIDYPAWEQIKELAPIILLAMITGILVYIIDIFMVTIDAIDFVRLLIGGTVGVLSFILLAQIVKLSIFKELKIIVLKRK
ncbi:lipopolysaccharide biosynthesis protein [Gelidibacter gilvus]|uniref:Lipopolysaccharide biosynthesis protein n=1 Tax=Gelidibacter gilvus TaxID=59602 RepID=A0A4Q0XEP2_9FLAO|nr:lipopolysaccharide biosynthesis protein [Gelidibacter gilvus]RXJ46028.1 lipopolysaccharide biosynthesis protein [Gelidibacter gilvus]